MSSHNLPIVLSPEAQDDQEDIESYTIQQWGDEQWVAYEALLHHAYSTLGANPRIDRARDDLRPGYRTYTVGQHLLVYRVDDDAVIILRVVHTRRDLRQVVQEES